MSHDKILFSTAYIDDRPYDYVGQYSPDTRFRDAFPRDLSFGLRFIKQNVPPVEILEYPTAAEFRETLRQGWDVVGFSFYLNETGRLIQMVDWARRAGVREIWGGNYGAINPQLEGLFDRRFVGYAEAELQALLGLPRCEIVHPPLVMHVSWPSGTGRYLTLFPAGILFTTRGCSFRCSFCQTPAFAPKPQAIPLERIRAVLEYYRAQGVHEVMILDENFGNIPQHSEHVIQLLAELHLNWTAMTRLDLINRNFESWVEHGFAGALMGLESVSQQVLDRIQKKGSFAEMKDVIARMNRCNLLTIGFYITGFETDTAESLSRDIRALAELNLDLTQVCILTPFPGTPLWNEIEGKYGIVEKDYEKYDAGHLVWNHPHLSPAEARGIVEWSLYLLQSPRTFFRRTVKWELLRVEKYGRLLAPLLLKRSVGQQNSFGLRLGSGHQPITLFPLKGRATVEGASNRRGLKELVQVAKADSDD